MDASTPVTLKRSTEALSVGDGNLALGMVRLVEAALELGATQPMVVIGREDDRFDREVPWLEQLSGVLEVLWQVSGDVRTLGARVLIKTHQEIASWEVLRLLEAVGSESFGVAFDPVNLLVRMEDPVEAAARLAGCIAQVHLDDCRIVSGRKGFARQLCPMGDGSIDWANLSNHLMLPDPDAWYWGEIHLAELVMSFYDPAWFDYHPDIELIEVASWCSNGCLIDGSVKLSPETFGSASTGFVQGWARCEELV